MSFSSEGVAVAQVKPTFEGRYQLLACDYIVTDPQSPQPHLLGEAVSRLGLRGAAINLVLPPSKYNLLMIEPPPVSDEEMKEAVRWRIKNLVDYDVESAAVDFFHIPEDAFQGRSPMIYVAVAPHNVVSEAENLVSEAGLKLKFIDAAQLALCNLLQGGMIESQATAILFLEQGESMLSIVKDDLFYLGRRLQTNTEQLLSSGFAHDDALNTLVLELQRSMDYFESQLGQAPVRRVMLMPMAMGDAHLSEQLGSSLGVKMEVADFADNIDGVDMVDAAILPKCVSAIAGAMRQETT